jgi:addiction module HigA family antidote
VRRQLERRILNGRQRRPTHPGELLREDVMPAASVTQAGLAKALGVSRKTISEIVLEQRPLTVDMAVRLGKFFKNGPALWLRMQQAVDLWDAIQANRANYEKIKPIKHRRAVA